MAAFNIALELERSPQLSSSSLIERYGKPVEELRAGTLSEVFITEKNYAVKITKRQNVTVKGFDNNLITTKELLPSELSSIVYPLCLNHPNIIKYFNVFVGTDDISLVMRIYEGDVVDLLDIPGNVFHDMRLYKSLCFQMVSAVAYLTSRGILHGDIKPENILYQHVDANTIKFVLADFDLAQSRNCQAKQKRYGVYYTLNYRPPEFLIPYDRYDESADVWALGITLASIYKHGLVFQGEDEKTVISELYDHVPPEMGPFSSAWKKFHEGRTESYNIPFTSNSVVEKFLRKMIHLEPSRRISIFDLQYDDFLAPPFQPYIIKHNTCVDKINYFDRQIEFKMLLRIPTIKSAWSDIINWFLKHQPKLKKRMDSIQITLGAIELAARYFLIQPNIDNREYNLIFLASMYITIIFDGDIIVSKFFSSEDKYNITASDVIDKAVEILSDINFDLCAKTKYDEIYRHKGIISNKILDSATELLLIAFNHLRWFVDYDSADIAFQLSTFYHSKGIYTLNISERKLNVWKKTVKKIYHKHKSDYRKRFRNARKVIKSWKK